MAEPIPAHPAADLSRIFALVPLRGLEAAKSRLGAELDPEERTELVGRLLVRTIRAARDAGLDVLVVSPDPSTLEIARRAGAGAVEQSAGDLNDGLRLARRAAVARGATAVLALPADLVAIGPEAIRELVGTARGRAREGRPVVAIVPDRHGSGTNALLLSPPDVVDFAFGEGSRERHVAAARAAGAVVVEGSGALTLDLDTPDDLLLAEPLIYGRQDA